MANIEVITNPAMELAKVEIDSQIATAKQYPRDEVAIIKKVEKLCTIDKDTAADCFYAKPIGEGKTASGESIRFAEILGSIWGNLRIRTYIKEETQKTVSAVCEIQDLETNVAISSEVSRSIFGKHGRYSESTIEVTKLAAQAIARRNAILQIIPKGLFSTVLEKIKGFASGKNETVNKQAVLDSAKKCLTAFKKYGVENDTVFAKVGIKTIDEITPEILEILLGFGTALKEGSSVNEIFGNANLELEQRTIQPKEKTE